MTYQPNLPYAIINGTSLELQLVENDKALQMSLIDGLALIDVNTGQFESNITLKEITTPTALADYGKIYTKSDNYLYFQDGAGTEHNVTGSVSPLAASTDNAIVRWNGTTGFSIQNSGVIVDDLNNITGILTLTATTINGTTFDTNVAAAAVTLAGTTLAADGTNANIDITITPKGTGSVVMSKVDINGGAIDGTIIGAASAAAITGTAINGTSLGIDGTAIFNESSADVDFRIESNGNANMFFVDGGTNQVYINSNTQLQDHGIMQILADGSSEGNRIAYYAQVTNTVASVHIGYSSIVTSAVANQSNASFWADCSGASGTGVNFSFYGAAGNLYNAGDIYTDAWTDWSASCNQTGWLTSGLTKTFKYHKIGRMVFVFYYIGGTSTTGATIITLPYTSNMGDNVYILTKGRDNGGTYIVSNAYVSAGTVTFYKDMSATAYTTSGVKTIMGEFWYEATS